VIYFANYQFCEPGAFLNWTTTDTAGIFAILVQDSASRSRPFKAIYFGESGNLSEHGFFKNHHRCDCWVREAGSEADLYISVFPMPDSTPELRQGIEGFLIKYYKPACNL
jgi:hypothetical protein